MKGDSTNMTFMYSKHICTMRNQECPLIHYILAFGYYITENADKD